MTEKLLDTQQVETFQRDGFLVVENVFPSAQRALYGDAVDAAVAG